MSTGPSARPRLEATNTATVQAVVFLLAACTLTIAALSFASTAIAAAPELSADTQSWVPDGRVTAVAADDAVTYVAGEFRHVAPVTGNAAFYANPGLARNDGVAAFFNPGPDSQIRTAISDGNGGWYIAGNFTVVAGAANPGLVHLNADLSIDSSFVAPSWVGTQSAVVGQIKTMLLSGNNLYVGGRFNAASPAELGSCLNVLNASTGALIGTGIDCGGAPGANGVNALSANVSTLFAAGAFAQFKGSARKNVAAIDISGGTLAGALSAFNPSPQQSSPSAESSVNAILISGSRLFLGGWFAQVGATARHNIAAFDLSISATGPPLDGSFNPDASSGVNSIVGQAGATTIFVGGEFAQIGGATRARVAELSSTSGIATGFQANLEDPRGSSAAANTLALSGNSLLIGGDFQSAGGTRRDSFAQVNRTTGAVESFDPGPHGEVTSIASTSAGVLLGGAFTTAGGVERNGLAAIDDATGTATNFNPDFGFTGFNAPTKLALNGGTLYAAGYLSMAGEPKQNRLISIDKSTSLVSQAFDVPISKTGFMPPRFIGDIVFAGSRLYLGGTFDTVKGIARPALAAVDKSTGQVDPGFSPVSLGGSVNALALDGSTLYVGGQFSGSPRNTLAALNAATGALDGSFTADGLLDFPVWSLMFDGSTLYVGGAYNQFAGAARSGFTALGASGNLLALDVPSSQAAGTRKIVDAGNHLALLSQRGVQFVDTATGVATLIQPFSQTAIPLSDSVSLDGTTRGLFVGGNFVAPLGADLLTNYTPLYYPGLKPAVPVSALQPGTSSILPSILDRCHSLHGKKYSTCTAINRCNDKYKKGKKRSKCVAIVRCNASYKKGKKRSRCVAKARAKYRK